MLKKLIEKAQALAKLLRMSHQTTTATPPPSTTTTTKTELPPPATTTDQTESKKHGTKKKVAALIAYNGSGYYGLQLQKNDPYPTIEGEIMKALFSAGAITQEHHDNPRKMWYQRAARTDKNVSAITNVVSLNMRVDVDNLVEKINEALPGQIRFFGYVRTTKKFDCKLKCTGRTYKYIMPTYALAPCDKLSNDNFRVTEEILEKTNNVLKLFVGTHNFHNYTSGVKPNEGKAKRYMRSFVCGKPYTKEGIEFVQCTVNGQSFMLHHIRKMIGITIAIVRGYCGVEVIDKSWGPEKVDIPRAPGFGLMLDRLEFDGYNKKFGGDGEHAPVEWSAYKEEIGKFRDEMILPSIYKMEKEERPMMSWLQTLTFHIFDVHRNPDGDGNRHQKGAWSHAFQNKLLRLKGHRVELGNLEEENENKEGNFSSGNGVKASNSSIVVKDSNSVDEMKQGYSVSMDESKGDNPADVENKGDNSFTNESIVCNTLKAKESFSVPQESDAKRKKDDICEGSENVGQKREDNSDDEEESERKKMRVKE